MAAFLVEPILGEGGYVVPPDGFLPALREVADRHGILLIADEVQTGYGRTGRFFATEWTDARPDIVVMAKGIASGMPLSGIMARRELLDRFAPGAHGGTYGGNAVACAAAVATLDVFEGEGLVGPRRTLRASGCSPASASAAAGHPHVAEVRGRGLMVGIEFADPDTLAPRPDLAKRLLHEALDRIAAAALLRHLGPGRAGHPAAGHDRSRDRPGPRRSSPPPSTPSTPPSTSSSPTHFSPLVRHTYISALNAASWGRNCPVPSRSARLVTRSDRNDRPAQVCASQVG